jgi:hypothetical protein
MTDPRGAGLGIANSSLLEDLQVLPEHDDDEGEADDDDDENPYAKRQEVWFSRSDFGTLAWWSRT